MKMKRKKGFFSISAVAEMFSIHQQTIRLYEKEGLITPKRSEGNTRLFSEEDVNRLEEIIYLTHQLGINLAGVDMIFKLKRQINKMQKDMNKLFDTTRNELDKEAAASQQAVSASASQLARMKQMREPIHTNPIGLISQESTQKTEESRYEDQWKIEYEYDE